MHTAVSWFNPNTLKQLRKQSGLTPAQVETEARKLQRSQYARVTCEQLAAWEGGTAEPELAQLETLSEAYGCPVGQFFLNEVPNEPQRLSFRGLTAGKEKRFDPDTIRSIRQFLKLREWFTSAIREHEIGWNVRLRAVGERADVDQLVAEQRRELGFAESVRSTWHTADDALLWWRRQIEEQGVFCIELKLKPSDIRGASIWDNAGQPFILLNHQDAESATGRLFTLLHEYGHLLMSDRKEGIACDFHGRDHGQDCEPRANRFAARMLVSLEEFKASLGTRGELRYREDWTDAELTRIGKALFVSRDVAAILLQEARLAPKDLYKRKRAAWERQYANKKPWGGRGRNPKHWERKARELGRSGIRALVTLDEKAALPVLDLAYMLDTKVEKVGQFIGEFRTVLQQ